MVTPEVRVLGPVEVRGTDGAICPVGGARPRAILLALSLADGATVSTERLVAEVWGQTPPPSAVDTLQSYLSRLRRVLAGGRRAPDSALGREPSGYRLDLTRVGVDAIRFDAEVSRARQQLTAGELEAGVRGLRQALARWRGEVGEGLELGAASRAEAARLAERRLAAIEARRGAELELGRHAEVVAELEALVAAHPVRERLHGLRMLARYRSGRQAEALDAYRVARHELVESLGVEPTRQLADLHARILAQDPGLDLPAPGGRAAATPAPRSAGGVDLGNLPAALVEPIGREQQLVGLREALGQDRLITLTGAGGCGKTLLASTAARHARGAYPDGVWWVELQTLDDAALVPGAVAEVLGVDDAELPALLDALVVRLAGRRALLVLDNAEHVIDGCADLVHELLLRVAGLTVLVTSRQPLDLDGERVWRVPSLSLPPEGADLDDLARSDAAQLFLRRARAVHAGYEPGSDEAVAIAAICRELDGIPLALELAAARLRVLSAEQVAARLDDRFRLLRSSRRAAPPRHRTLAATVAWSEDLLDAPSRRLFRRLAVFQGGFTLVGAEAVCADADLPADDVLEHLDGLVERSLVLAVPTPVGPARHRLPQSIRSFARDRLGPAELEALRARHAAHLAALADTARAELTGRDQVRWLNRLHAEHDDLRAALTWSLARGRPDPARKIVAGAWWFWLQFGHVREGADWAEQVLAELDDAEVADDELALLARARHGAGRLAAAVGEVARARRHLEAGRVLALRAGDHDRAALCDARLAHLEHAAGLPAAAVRRLEVARRAAAAGGDAWVGAALEDVAGQLAAADHDLDAAAAGFALAEQGYLAVEDRWSACLSRLGRAWVARRRGAWDEAAALHVRNLRAIRSLTRSAYDFVGLARDLRGVAAVAGALDHHEPAARLAGAAENLRSRQEVALTPDEGVEAAEVRRRAGQALGEPAAAAARAAGRALGAAEALEEALRVAEGISPAPVSTSTQEARG